MQTPSPEIQARCLARLRTVEAALEPGDYAGKIFGPSAEHPVPALVVPLEPDEDERERELNVTLMPLGSAEVDATEFLQFYVLLPFTAPEDLRAAAAQAATIVNNHLAVGHFGVNPQGQVFFRYVLALPLDQPPDDGMLRELVAFVEYTQEHFGDYLEGVCEDEISVLVLEDLIREADSSDLA